jgi:nitrile hydratase accessory protein
MSTFAEPWEARAFAIVKALQDGDMLTKAEWTDALSTEIRRNPDDGHSYYHRWLAALENVVTEKNLIPAEALIRCQTAWARAADRTPHGDPIELCPEDFT